MHNSSTANVYLTYIVNIPTLLHKNITPASQNAARKKQQPTLRWLGSPLKTPLNTDHMVAQGIQYRSVEQTYQGHNAPQGGLVSRHEENCVVAMNSTHSSPTSCEDVLSKCDGAKVIAPFWLQWPSSSRSKGLLLLAATPLFFWQYKYAFS